MGKRELSQRDRADRDKVFPCKSSARGAKVSRAGQPELGPLMQHLATIFVALFVVGCLSDPPTYRDSQRLPPFVVVDKTDPPPWVFTPLNEGETLVISLWFYSEDLGDDLRALTYVDLLPGEQPVTADDPVEIPAGSYEEIRSVRLEVPNLAAGCHAVTVVLTHVSNLDDGTVVDKDRAARVVWWANVKGAQGSGRIDDCPVLGTEE